MRRLGRVFVCLVALAAVVGAGPASAASPSSTDYKSVVIDGRTFGPKDGLQVDTYRVELISGSTDEVGMIFTDAASTQGGLSPMATWGSELRPQHGGLAVVVPRQGKGGRQCLQRQADHRSLHLVHARCRRHQP